MPVCFASGNQVSLVTPQPKLRNTIRFGGATGEAADAKRRKPSDSSAGSAMSVARARRNDGESYAWHDPASKSYLVTEMDINAVPLALAARAAFSE